MRSHRGRPFRRAAYHAACIAGASLGARPAPVVAQGVTTAAIRGTVRTSGGDAVDLAVVRVTNQLTGYRVEARTTRGGFYSIQGLEIGGPYTIDVRHVGFEPKQQTAIRLVLGEWHVADFTIASLAVRLDSVRVAANALRTPAATAGGVGMVISDSTLRRLPTLNGDLYDHVRVLPQVGTRSHDHR